MNHLWEVNHPYYAAEGCYYTNHVVGHRDPGGYDGVSCHINYESWADFKAGNPMPYTNEQLEMRRMFGIDDVALEESRKRYQKATGSNPFTFIDADKDYNLLYRWDWEIPNPDDYDDNEEKPSQQLKLFYMLQRKAMPLSICIYNMTPEDETEVREFIQGYWEYMQNLWAPISRNK